MLLLVTRQSSVCCLAVSHPPYIHRASSAEGWPAQTAPGECLPRSSTGSRLAAGRPSLCTKEKEKKGLRLLAPIQREAKYDTGLSRSLVLYAMLQPCSSALPQSNPMSRLCIMVLTCHASNGLDVVCLPAITPCQGQNFQQGLGCWID